MPKFLSFNLFRIFKIYYFYKNYTNSCLQRFIITVDKRKWSRRNKAICYFIYLFLFIYSLFKGDLYNNFTIKAN